MGVDGRTRSDGTARVVDAQAFFTRELPSALARTEDLLRPSVTSLSPPPLAVDVDGETWTLRADGGRVVIDDGATEGARTLVLSGTQLSDLVDDQVTPMGWFASGALAGTARLERLLDWWLVLRGALDGVAPHRAGDVVFRDPEGSPLDLSRGFRPDDDPAAMRTFLEEAGYLHLTGVFTAGEMAAVSADMDREAPGYTHGDGRSWWARTEDGEDRLVRMQGFDERSEAVAALVGDQRFLRLGDLTGDGHEWGGTGFNRIEALVKPIGVVEGISDVPWHKDCSLGRHSYECCSLTVGVSVTGADAGSGQLRVIAGSHRALVWPALLRDDLELPVVDLPTATGDVTVHLSCTLHMAQPPVDRERRVLYSSFRLPPRDAEAERAAEVRLRAIREQASVTVSQPSAATGGRS